jgi:hypothetical protein
MGVASLFGVQMSQTGEPVMNGKLLFTLAMLGVMISAPAAATPISSTDLVSCPDPCSFDAHLSGAGEEPPNASPARGFANIGIDVGRDVLFLAYEWGLHGDPRLLGGATGAQIHVINGPGDTNTSDTLGPAVTPLPSFPGFGYFGSTGGFHLVFGNSLLEASTYNPEWVSASGSVQAAELELIAALVSGRAYFEIDSSAFPAGEIRGFFTPAEPLPTIPEPASVLLFGSGVVLLAARRRHEKHQPLVHHRK